MAPRKGSPKTGGRKKGTPNKIPSTMLLQVAATGETPVQFMLSIMRNKKCKLERRFEAAKAVAPYVHNRLSAVEEPLDHSKAKETSDKPKMNLVETAKFILFLMSEATEEEKKMIVIEHDTQPMDKP